MLVIVLTMNKAEKTLAAEPDLITRGFVYVRDSEELLRNVRERIIDTVQEMDPENKSQWNIIKYSIKKSVGQYVFSQTKRKPMILPADYY